MTSPFTARPLDAAAVPGADARVASFLRSVYAWMGAGLAVTAVVAWYVANSPAILGAIVGNRAIFWGLIIAQFGVVLALSAMVQRLSAAVAALLFIGYSALTGVTMAFVLLAYTGQSVASTFAVAAGMFGGMALFGTLTKRSLAGWSQFLMMGLMGVVIASLVGIFWQNESFHFILAFCGVVTFTGLAAYDAQMLKQMALALPAGRGHGAYAINGALKLYLDFINLFLMMLRLFGDRR